MIKDPVNPFESSPALIPFVCVAAGVVLAGSGAGLVSGCCLIIIGAVIYMIILKIKAYPSLYFRFSKFHPAWIALWFLGVGMISGDLQKPYSHPEDDFSGFVSGEGIVKKISDKTSGESLVVEVERLFRHDGEEEEFKNLTIHIHTTPSSVRTGDKILFPVRLERISDSPNSFFGGYAKSMADKGIFYTQSVPANELRVTAHKPSFIPYSLRLRDRIALFIESTPLEKKTAYFLNTLLLGDRSYLLPETQEIFRNAGIAHVLALSGMHVGIIAGVLLFLLFPINFMGLFRWRLLLTALILWGYALVSGMAPSTVRACIMISMMFISIFTQRKSTSFNSLCVAGLLILLFDPRAIFDIGFQLSFVCVAAIILFVKKMNMIDQRAHNKTYKIVGTLIITVITTFCSWVLIAHYYGQIPLNFIPANILILPLIPLFIVIALLYFILHAIGFNGSFITGIVDRFYNVIECITRFSGGNENGVITVSPSNLSVFLWLTGMLLLALAIYYRKKLFTFAGSGLLILTFLVITFQHEPDTENLLICDSYSHIEIKVRNGNSETPVILPHGETSLTSFSGFSVISIDSPETVETLENKKNQLINHINGEVDLLIITGSNKLPLETVYRIFSPKLTMIHPTVRKEKELRLLSEADSLGIPIHSLRIHRPLGFIVK